MQFGRITAAIRHQTLRPFLCEWHEAMSADLQFIGKRSRLIITESAFYFCDWMVDFATIWTAHPHGSMVSSRQSHGSRKYSFEWAQKCKRFRGRGQSSVADLIGKTYIDRNNPLINWMKHAATIGAISRESQDKNLPSQDSTLNRISGRKIWKRWRNWESNPVSVPITTVHKRYWYRSKRATMSLNQQ
jgi:hypothetical protein